jgi:Tol biopolymer transport system component
MGLAISPDSSQIVYSTGFEWTATSLYSRHLNSTDVAEIKGTRGAKNPFFSPDGKWIGFFDLHENELKKMPSDGGQAVTLVSGIEQPESSSAFWSKDIGIIFTSTGGPINRISEEGGEPEILLTPKERQCFTSLQYLSDSHSIIYTEWERPQPSNRIKVLDLKSKTSRLLLDNAAYGRYLDSGHLLFTRDRTLLAVPFDIERFKVSGSIKPLELPMKTGYIMAGYPQFQFVVSREGTLVYGWSLKTERKESILEWIDQKGEAQGQLTLPVLYPKLSLSPVDSRIAISSLDGIYGQLSIFDPERGGLLPIETGYDHSMPVWSPDGSRLVFQSSIPEPGLYSKVIDAGSQPVLILKDSRARTVFSWSKDGKYIAYTRSMPDQQEDIWILPMNPQAEAFPFLASDAREDMPSFSPDGHWLAYTSDKIDGILNVFVQSFPEGGRETRISEGSGKAAIWNPDGKDLFYTSVESDTIYRIPFVSQPKPKVGNPQELFKGTFLYNSQNGYTYDFSSKTNRFLMAKMDEPRWSPQLVVVLNWFEELKRLWPEKK